MRASLTILLATLSLACQPLAETANNEGSVLYSPNESGVTKVNGWEYAQKNNICTEDWINSMTANASKHAAAFAYSGKNVSNGVTYSGGYKTVAGKKHAVVSRDSNSQVSLQRGQSWGSNGPSGSMDPRSLKDELYAACANAFPEQFGLKSNYPGSVYKTRSASSVSHYSVNVFDQKVVIQNGLKMVMSGSNEIEYIWGKNSFVNRYNRSGALGGGAVRAIH